MQTFSLEKYGQIARTAAAEGCVLLRNENEALPLRKGDKVAVFGRCATHYYKSGLGSGGLVNTRYVVGILDALCNCENITLEEKLLDRYQAWGLENPIDEGHGWGTVPWSQQEMPVTEEMLDVAADADIALVIVGRTAGEDQDNEAKEGSYLLTKTEEDMIAKVSARFERTVVILNVGNIIDMKWVETYQPAAVLYVWQGGQEGGNGVVDVLTGRVNPCGKLTDTIAYDINDYPSTAHFGEQFQNIYEEDIYVGYRYFETFAKDKVLYPFGFGLSYSTFDITAEVDAVTEETVTVRAKVTNTGKMSGKEVVQVYIEAPQGALGKPARVLAGFGKTSVLEPGATELLLIDCPKKYFAAYDDCGVTGHKSCYVLEAGSYNVYAGSDVRSASCCGKWEQKLQVIEQLEEACAPVEVFNRMKPEATEGGYRVVLEAVPQRTLDMKSKILKYREEGIPYSGDKGIKLGDVLDGNATMEAFIAQLSDEDLINMFRGEGMCSSKVTPGTAGAFGGVTDELKEFGIPMICCADGPSGIRMDCGAKAFSLPNGTSLGCTFNLELNRELFEMVGMELRKNKVDTLLGPGINIHRSPLNGRNFEYISEDPLLTGKMGAAQLQGIHTSNVTGTIKHFCANNQEHYRRTIEAAMSERALREIYLRGFEIAVKEGDAKSIMSSYNPVNGTWASGNFDLCTMILRKEWGYTGIIMTDWWATANWDREPADNLNRAPMVRAQNDLYMCCADSKADMDVDNVKASLEQGEITRYELQRNAANILKFIMETPAMLRMLGRVTEEFVSEDDEDEDDISNIPYFAVSGETKELILLPADMDLQKKEMLFGLEIPQDGFYGIEFEMVSDLTELAQLPLSIYVDNMYRETYSFRGTEGKTQRKEEKIGDLSGKDHYVKLVRQGNGLDIASIRIWRKGDLVDPR